MDLELAIDALELSDTVDHMVIFSGDGNFRPLVEALQRRGRKVSIVSTVSTNPAMIADDLRRQADNFLELTSLVDEIGRESDGSPNYRNDDDGEDEFYDDD